MNIILKNGILLYEFTALKGESNLEHFVSGRLGGVSVGELSGLNLSFSVGDREESVIRNREILSEALEIDPDQLFFVSQYHSDQVLIVESKYNGVPSKADALVTNVPNICICVMGADCVPLLAYDPIKKVIAAIHAGWKGTAASITSKTLQIMSDKFGSNPEDIKLAIGPSISQEKYEVGEEVYTSFLEQQGKVAKDIFKYDEERGKYFPDLWESNALQAKAFGLKEENIEKSEICTYSSPDEFYSARYFKNKTGRFAAGIMLR